MNACSIKGTPYEKEYRSSLGLSEPAMILVWNANNEQPLDKRKVGDEVIDNPLYKGLLEHPITQGNRINALKLVAQSFLPTFTKQYEADETGNYSVEQVVDFMQKKQQQVQQQREQIQQSINIPTSMSINLADVEINGQLRSVFFSAEQGQDIYDTLQYLLGENKSWDNVYNELVSQRDRILSRIKAGTYYAEDPERLAYTEIIIKSFDKIKSWYDSKEGMVGEEELDDELGDSEDWKSKDKSQAQRASSSILGLVASLPGYRTAIPGEIDFQTGEEYQEVSQVQVQSSVIGLPKAGDFQKNWSLLGTKLSGLTSYTEIYEAIKELAARYPQFEYLLKKIPNPNVTGAFKDIKQFLLASEFKRVFSVPEVTSVVLDITKKDDSEKGIATTQQVKGFQPIRNAVGLYDSQYFSYNQRYLIKGLEGNEVNLDKIEEDFSALFKNLGAALANKVPAENFLFGTRVEEFVRFLQAVGLGLNNQTYLNKSNQQATTEFIKNNLSNIKIIYEKIKNLNAINSYLTEESKIRVSKPLAFLRDTIQELYESKNVLKPEIRAALSQGIADGKIKYSGKNENEIIRKVINFLGIKKTELSPFITFFTQYDAEFRPSSYLNAEDKKKFIRGPWFFLTQQTKVINGVKSYGELINTPGFERFDYRKNPDVLGSVWLERMFGLPRTINEIEKKDLNSYERQKDVLGNLIELNVTNFDGTEIKNFGPKSGKTTTNQHPGDKIFQDFVSFFQSTEMENIRFGDKSSAFSVKWSNPVFRDKMYVGINPTEMFEPTERSEAEPALTNIFKGYLASEVKRILNLIEEKAQGKARGTTYDKQGQDLFIFKDILPETTLDKFRNATSREEIVAAYTEATAMLPTALQEYFANQSQLLVKQLVDIFTTSVNLETGNLISDAQRLKQTVTKLNSLNFLNSQLFPVEYKNNIPKITPENLAYVAELYIKNGFVHNIEFMKMFVGDIANFDKLQKDAREVFKRIPFTSSPGNVFFWDQAAIEFFEEDTNQDALSRAYTGISNKFGPVLKTVIYNDVNSFSPEDYETYKKAYDSDNWDKLTEEEQSEFSEYANNPKEADAQAVITLDTYRNYLLGINRWSVEQEKAYNKQVRLVLINQELKNNPTNAEELYKEKIEITENFGAALFPPLKLGHYGPIVEDPKLNALHKFSLIPLVPSVIQGKQLEKQLELMYQNGINYYTFKSGSKMAQFGKPVDFYKEVTNAQGEKVLVVNDEVGDDNITSIHLHNLKEQQYQAPKFKGKATLSTQMMKLIFGDFFEDGEVSSDFSEGTQKEISQLYDVFKRNLEDIVTYEKVKLERKLGIKRDSSGNIVSVDQLQMARFFAEQLEAKEAPESLRRFIQVDEQGNFKYPLDAINNRNQLEELVLNTINNKIISQKINGESYIQVAGTGFEEKRYKKPTPEQLRQYGANELQYYRKDPITRETLPMEVKIGFNPKKHKGLLNLEYQGGKVGTLTQLNKILKSNLASDIAWKKKHMDKLTMVGVRIPVQGFNSMEHVVVKEFLPESAGAIMVLPAQIVVKSGGDYDIDKLTFFETSYNQSGQIFQKNFDLKDYEAKLERQKELKKAKQELLALKEITQKELSENEIYRQRDALKKEINDIKKEIEEAITAIDDFIDSGYINKDDASWLRESAADKQDLQVAFLNLDKFDQENDLRTLQVVSKLRNELRRVSQELESIEEYKNSLTNNLVSTLISVLKQDELYDTLITPNTNSVLTQDLPTSKKISTTDIFNPLTSWKIYLENILSKDALGIDAKINTLQKEFQRAGLKFTNPLLKRYYFESNKDAEGNIILGGKKDARGKNRISKVLSEFINGHVDIAKEDWIILLGLDQETSPLAHAMIIAGTPVEHVLGLINSPIIKTVFQLGNRPEIHKKLDKIKPNKKQAIVGLIKANLTKIKNPELKKIVDTVSLRLSQLKVKSNDNQADLFVNLLLSNPIFNKHITNFNPKESLTGEEAIVRDLAYLTQFYVVLKQQESLRKLTSLTDFNTSNYRTSFQVDNLNAAKSQFKNDFNESAIEFMFGKSALAQFNVSSFVHEVMSQIYPLSDSAEVHKDIDNYIAKKNLYKSDDILKAVQTYKNNLLVPYTLLTAQTEGKGNLLEYYRGKKGVFLRTTPNNMEQRFDAMLQYPELRDNFVINNIYIDQENSGTEIEFKLKNTEVEENSKAYRIAFLEGLNSSNPEIKSFFEDLGLGSYLQYAGSFSSGHVANIVPHEVYISYSDKAYRDLLAMKNSDPKKFNDYLALVRFSTKMTQETTGPIKGLASFFTENYSEMAKTITTLTPSVAKVLSNIEQRIQSAEEVSESSISINEFDVADTLPPIAQNFADGTGGRAMQPQFKGKSTMDLIISGDRTRTTRAKTDIQRMAKDYSLSKISDLVGKVIRMTDNTGRQVYTRITKVAPFTQEYQDATWQKEGWEKSVTDKHVGDYPYAIEFEVVNKPTQSPTAVKPGVSELFESNPELANAVYEALGFEVATEDIEIIPDVIGKTIEVETVDNEYYKAKITSIEKRSEDVILLKAKTAKGKEYSYLINLQGEAVGNKQHFQYVDSPDLWKGVYTYNVTPQQKQQAEQLYSQYIEQTGKQDIEGFKKFVSGTPTQNLPSSETKINIYAGTGENTELSNFANRPFKFQVQPIVTAIYGEKSFDSVEQAFQWHKGLFAEAPAQFAGSGSKTVQIMRQIKETKNGAEIKKLGRQYFLKNAKGWDRYSSGLMKDLLKASFEQNPDALAKLLATGNATLTHTQDKTKWGVEFPKLLMEVREELRLSQPSVKTTSLTDFTNHSGGALGADIAWDEIGQEFGMTNNKHYWMNNKTPKGNAEITQQDAIEGQQKVTNAARNMGRIEPTHQVRDERLIRNWSQVKYADAVFAVTTMLSVGAEMNYGKKAKIRQGKGGTGYAIQMAIEAGKPVYVYDQVRKQWFKNIDGVWSSSEVPVLTKNFAGIGTREINKDGLQAIRDVYAATLNQTNDISKDSDVLENFEGDVNANETIAPQNTLSNFTPPKTDSINLDLRLDPNQSQNDEDNLDDLGFEEDSCEL